MKQKNQFLAPNRNLKSASALCEDSALIKPRKRVGWELQKTVPVEIRNARIIQEAKEARQEFLDTLRAKQDVRKSIPLGVLARKLNGTYKVVGHGVSFPTFGQVKDFAKSIGRSFVKMGAVKAKV